MTRISMMFGVEMAEMYRISKLINTRSMIDDRRPSHSNASIAIYNPNYNKRNEIRNIGISRRLM
jgi:hypothetical protein